MVEERGPLSGRERLLSLLEVCAAIAVVAGHNVYHVIPNEVPILVLLALLSFRLRERQWGTALYRRPRSWRWTIAAAVGCFVLLLLKDSLVEVIGQHFWPGPQHPSSILSRSGDWVTIGGKVLFVWVFAAFGEEISYRGYLLRRAVDVFGFSRMGAVAALLVASAAFGLGHFYKGPAGILDSTGSGVILGAAYLFSRRLWVSTLAHGINDTAAVVFSSLGW